MVGKSVSHFRIIGKLGQGGMGEVFLAEETNLNQCGPERPRVRDALRSKRGRAEDRNA